MNTQKLNFLEDALENTNLALESLLQIENALKNTNTFSLQELNAAKLSASIAYNCVGSNNPFRYTLSKEDTSLSTEQTVLLERINSTQHKVLSSLSSFSMESEKAVLTKLKDFDGQKKESKGIFDALGRLIAKILIGSPKEESKNSDDFILNEKLSSKLLKMGVPKRIGGSLEEGKLSSSNLNELLDAVLKSIDRFNKQMSDCEQINKSFIEYFKDKVNKKESVSLDLDKDKGNTASSFQDIYVWGVGTMYLRFIDSALSYQEGKRRYRLIDLVEKDGEDSSEDWKVSYRGVVRINSNTREQLKKDVNKSLELAKKINDSDESLNRSIKLIAQHYKEIISLINTAVKSGDQILSKSESTKIIVEMNKNMANVLKSLQIWIDSIEKLNRWVSDYARQATAYLTDK